MRRILLIQALVLMVGCSGSSSPSDAVAPTQQPTAPASETPPEPLVGTWQRVTTCQEFVRVQREAGFEEFVLEGVTGNGFLPGVGMPDQLTDPSQPCDGAVPREHSHFFTEDGRFGSLDWTGQQVDDGTYEIVDGRTFMIGSTTFHYEITGGNTIMFEPVIPHDCTTKRCRESASWSVSVAYPGETWERVS